LLALLLFAVVFGHLLFQFRVRHGHKAGEQAFESPEIFGRLRLGLHGFMVTPADADGVELRLTMVVSDPHEHVAVYCRCHDIYVPILPHNSILGKIIADAKRLRVPLAIPFGIFFACPECAAVYVCRFDSLRHKIPEKGQRQPTYRSDADIDSGILPIRALGVCGTQSCGTQVEVHTAVDIGATKTELNRIAAKWDFASAVCPGCLRFLRDCLSRTFSFEGFDLAQ
jgi:hypothetical protein